MPAKKSPRKPLRLSSVCAALAFISGFAAPISSLAEAPYNLASTPGKLPKDIIPLEYKVHLQPEIEANRFRGTQSVEIEVLRSTQKIMLNAFQLEIESASISGTNLPEQKLLPQLDAQQQTLEFALPQRLQPGRYTLQMQFRGTINREGLGLFGLQYKVGEQEKKMLATNLEPSDARRILPLWDEPAFRAKFTLSVDAPSKMQAFSNMPIARKQELPDGMQRIWFATTPRMASYLLVLVVGEMERISAMQDGVEIGIVTTEGKLPSAQFALDSSKDLLRYYNQYFGVHYPLPKLDQIAIPGGFHGAMENWGGIVYNEAVLLYQPKQSSEETKQDSFAVNAHEMAHQWFGDLVTMAWWDNLWLNEGFASWMGTKATAHFHPEWRVWLQDLVARENVMNLDARASTHPIQTPIVNEEQAANAFDAITYGKGQAFLRMLEAYLGEEVFQRGMQTYMRKHQYSNTTSADLWQALASASGKPVAQIASDWTTQPGLPLITVTQSCQKGKRHIQFAQQVFRLDGSQVKPQNWHIPLQFGVLGRPYESILISKAKTKIKVKHAGCAGTLVVDPHAVGYFRLQYDAASFQALARQVNTLPETTRLQFLNDSAALVNAERMTVAAYWDLLKQLPDEPRQAVWDAILARLMIWDEMMRDSALRPQFRRQVIALILPKMRQLTWQEKPGESVEIQQLRANLMSALAEWEEPSALALARKKFDAYLLDPSSLEASSLDFVFSTVGKYAKPEDYANLLKLMQQASSSEERNRFASALAQADDPQLAARTLQLALSTELPPDLASIFVPAVASNHLHAEQAWEFAVGHREVLLNNLDGLGKTRFFPRLVSRSDRPVLAEKMLAFVQQYFSADALVEAKRVAERVHTRARQSQHQVKQLEKILQAEAAK